MADHGIDYSMGTTNIDLENGIRFGVIPMNDLAHWAWESFEDDYGEPTCPKCDFNVSEEQSDNGASDFFCEECNHNFMSAEACGEEPIGSHLQDEDYTAECYAFGHDWFEDGVAPYPVYEVATGKLMEPESTNHDAKYGNPTEF